jgi:hypothetical protein
MRRCLILLVVLLVVAACGDDDAAGDEALSKAEWIAAADAICAEDNAELALIPEPQTPEEAAEAGARAIQVQRTGLAEVRALVPPQGDEAVVGEILDSVEAVLDWSEEFIEALVAGDDAKAEELHAEGERLTEEAIRLAEEYGLQECVTSGE